MIKNDISILDNDINEIRTEMLRMNVHKAGIKIMINKADFKIVKVKNVPVVASNIIKQDMLALGGDVATHALAINHKVKTTDILIFGTVRQIHLLVVKLKQQYFGLKQLAIDIEKALKNCSGTYPIIKVKNRTIDPNKRTYLMGILNVTPDSFSDGGKFVDVDHAVEHALDMASDGADIIDIGGESTRPGSKGISIKEEISRVVPVIKALSKRTKAIISIDTTKAHVAEAAIKAGALMINDISGLHFDSKMAGVAAKYKVPIVLMHIQGEPMTMQKKPHYNDLMSDIIIYLKNSIGIAIKAGVSPDKLIVDPGFGFGKLAEHNLEILKKLSELKVLGCPILIGTSRKSTIGSVLGLPVGDRLEGTCATVAIAVINGASIVRVHDVKQISRVAKMCDSVYKG